MAELGKVEGIIFPPSLVLCGSRLRDVALDFGKAPPKPPLPGFSACPDGDEAAAASWLIPNSWKSSLGFGKSGPFQTRDNSALGSWSALCALCEFCQLAGDAPASFQGFFGFFFLSSPSS